MKLFILEIWRRASIFYAYEKNGPNSSGVPELSSCHWWKTLKFCNDFWIYSDRYISGAISSRYASSQRNPMRCCPSFAIIRVTIFHIHAHRCRNLRNTGRSWLNPPRNLTWQWQILVFNRRYIFEWWIFHRQVGFLGEYPSIQVVQLLSTTTWPNPSRIIWTGKTHHHSFLLIRQYFLQQWSHLHSSRDFVSKL